MAGHSKWKQIKHKKALLDAKKGKQFTKLIKEISIAARMGGGDPTGNPRLRLLLEKGKEINMPQENAVRAIKKGTGELPGQQYEAYTYEGYGPGNIAVIVDVLTDNKNKAIAEMRHVFTRNGGRIAENGSVSWMFEKAGVVEIQDNGISEDTLLEQLLDYDVKDIKREENTITITCEPKSLEDVKQALHAQGLKVLEAELEWIPKNTVALSTEQEDRAVEFLNALEELEDVQNVYTNLD
ncbi:MAG: YebC/PmpR family DNA-binding transcriptional regulator [Candidatus Dependentiae bacterium]|nr:YebC/PmpR family DNA-binding transcriptional regulator [Candidatus Dependentiae bacterium]